MKNACQLPTGLLLASLAFALVAPPAGAGVLVVDQTGGAGAGFVEIREAVVAASEGDTILVRDGVYWPFQIKGKSLTVIADGAGVRLDGSPYGGNGSQTVQVQDLAAHQAVLVRGFAVEFGVSVRDCEGSVWFDDLGSLTALGYCSLGISGAYVNNAAKVTFTRSNLVGEQANGGSALTAFAGAGLTAVGSTVQVFDCQLSGGAGGSPLGGFWTDPTPGAPGLRVDQSTVTVIGCTIQGGKGGLAIGPLCSAPHAPGGAGVLFVNGTGMVRAADSTAYGGVASLEPLCPGQTGPPGPAITGGGQVIVLPGYSRHLKANAPVRGGETLTFDVQGQPGEIPIVFTSFGHEPLPLLANASVLLIELPPADMFVLPPLPFDGRASLSFPIMDPGVGAVSYYAQAGFLDPSPAVWLSAGTTTVLVDSTY